jgi:molybdopterin synthase sulfur carrier subunit
MAIRVLFFASLRENLGTSGESIELPMGILSVGDLRSQLVSRGESWLLLATTKNLRAAVNQKMVGMDSPIKDGDEVAFFPPVTGG